MPRVEEVAMECSSYAGPMYFPYGGKAKVQRRPVRAATSTSFGQSAGSGDRPAAGRWNRHG